jgi:hypothetical protein
MPPPPATLDDLSASVTSPQSEASLNCTDAVQARITVTNRSRSPVAIQGILMTSGIVAGDCRGEGDFTYSPLVRTVLGNSTTVVFDRPLYANGSGCCLGRGCAGSCRFQEGFRVITDVGHVPAGVFNYRVFFQNCPPCDSAAGLGIPCAPALQGTAAP